MDEAGNGRPLIFVPGWSANGAEYVNVMYLLSKDYRVIVLDPRNQGLSQRVEYGGRIERFLGLAAEINVRTWADYHQRTFERGASYKKGALVAWDSSTWIAMADTAAVPGTSPDWQMIAKRGRDGRDRK